MRGGAEEGGDGGDSPRQKELDGLQIVQGRGGGEGIGPGGEGAGPAVDQGEAGAEKGIVPWRAVQDGGKHFG